MNEQSNIQLDQEYLKEAESIENNLHLMKTAMKRLLAGESIGSRTATISGKEYPCSGANGYMEKTSGRILSFELPNYTPDNIKNNKKNVHFLMEIAYNFDTHSTKIEARRITEVHFYDKISPEAESIFRQTIEEYNQTHWPIKNDTDEVPFVLLRSLSSQKEKNN